MSSLFDAARSITAEGALCYVNSEVILLDDFLPALDRIRARRRRYLMIGQCWNFELAQSIDFGDPNWRAGLRDDCVASAVLRGKWYIDYFAFPSDLYASLPPFAVGRAYFDNWLVWRARVLGASVVDATAVVTAVHQHHGYSHVPGGWHWSYKGPEARRNKDLGGGLARACHIGDASHVLTTRRFRRQGPGPLSFRYHWDKWLRAITWTGFRVTRPVRHRLGIRASSFRKLRSTMTRRSTNEP